MNCPQQTKHTVRENDNLYQLSRYYQTTVQEILAQNPSIDPYNLTVGSTIIICPGERFAMRPGNFNPVICSDPSAQFNLLANMRKAWTQHVYWTRMLLISIAARLPDQDVTAARLMENPADIASIFADYYPADAAKKIERLLTEHLQIGGELITALRDGKTAEADALNRQWYQNADQMADAFSGMNPYYNREKTKRMLHDHLELTTREVTRRLAGHYAADIEAFNKVEEEALAMADYFSTGIMRQLPQRFCRRSG